MRQFIKRRQGRLFVLYTVSLALVSISILLMPVGVDTIAVSYLSGALFWIGVIGAILTAAFITRSRRRSQNFASKYPHLRKWGVVHFFQNKYAFFCDVLMFLSVIGFVVTRIWFEKTTSPFIFLSLSIFFFGMHCMLNGSNYIYLKYQARRATKL